MTSSNFREIQKEFCKKIDKLQNYNNLTVNINLKMKAIDDCVILIKNIKNIKSQAIKKNDCHKADQLFHMQCMLNSLISSLKIWIFIEDKEFKKAWDSLIDAQEYLSVANKINEYEGSHNLQVHLNSIENSIFPRRKMYLSAAFTSTCGKCSICLLDFYKCDHIENNIYSGRLCYRKDIENIQGNHVALVENPADRRCIVTSYGEQNSIVDTFTLKEIELNDKCQKGVFHGHLLTFSKLDWD